MKAALSAGDPDALAAARAEVQSAKEGPGERGAVWWDDGAPDLNRRRSTTRLTRNGGGGGKAGPQIGGEPARAAGGRPMRRGVTGGLKFSHRVVGTFDRLVPRDGGVYRKASPSGSLDAFSIEA